MYRIAAVCVCLLAFVTGVQAAVQGKEVSYREGDTVLKGYMAWDDDVKGKRPGVLVVHEWWGHNDYARDRARMLASLGYTALAVDMYGDGKTAAHPDDAKKFSSAVGGNLSLAKARFVAALNVLTSHQTVDASKTAAIGYCFGGGMVLQMARQGVDLDGVVSFHGSLGTGSPAQPGAVKAQVLVYNGAMDPFVNPEQIGAFNQEMAAAGVTYSFVNLPGAKHSFTRPGADEVGKKFGLPLAYNKAADEKSWQGMQAFFKELFAD
ncbi:MAG: dienelactone hydrolase family protein [Granulosicoccaceae bacterium]|jgi:dienelactone hydrolase